MAHVSQFSEIEYIKQINELKMSLITDKGFNRLKTRTMTQMNEINA